jgi:hypothetical protein
VTRAGFTVMTLRQSNTPPNGKVNSPRLKKGRQVKSKVKSMIITFHNIKGIVQWEFVLAGQIVNSTYYCNILWQCMKMCEDFAPNNGDKRTNYCSMTMHHLTFPF